MGRMCFCFFSLWVPFPLPPQLLLLLLLLFPGTRRRVLIRLHLTLLETRYSRVGASSAVAAAIAPLFLERGLTGGGRQALFLQLLCPGKSASELAGPSVD